jgi:hypothetical protein
MEHLLAKRLHTFHRYHRILVGFIPGPPYRLCLMVTLHEEHILLHSNIIVCPREHKRILITIFVIFLHSLIFFFYGSFFLILDILFIYISKFGSSWFSLYKPPIPVHLTLLLWGCSPTNPPTSTHPHPSWHLAILEHPALTWPRASPPIDARQGHPQLHMLLEPWVPACVFFGWCFSPWELWGVWLVDIVVLPMELQTPLAPLILSLTPPLGNPCSVQWLAVSIHLCICQSLVEPLRSQLYQDSVSKHFLASAIVSWCRVCIWDGSLGRTISGSPFLQSLLHTCLCISFCEYFVPLLRKTEASKLY